MNYTIQNLIDTGAISHDDIQTLREAYDTIEKFDCIADAMAGDGHIRVFGDKMAFTSFDTYFAQVNFRIAVAEIKRPGAYQKYKSGKTVRQKLTADDWKVLGIQHGGDIEKPKDTYRVRMLNRKSFAWDDAQEIKANSPKQAAAVAAKVAVSKVVSVRDRYSLDAGDVFDVCKKYAKRRQYNQYQVA